MKKPPRKAVYLGKSVRMHKSACLDCGAALDGATSIGHTHKPRAGAIAICMKCGHIQAMGSDLQFRPLTDEEMVDVAGDERIIKVQKALEEVRKLKALKAAIEKFLKGE
jgi:hypothetical protein